MAYNSKKYQMTYKSKVTTIKDSGEQITEEISYTDYFPSIKRAEKERDSLQDEFKDEFYDFVISENIY